MIQCAEEARQPEKTVAQGAIAVAQGRVVFIEAEKHSSTPVSSAANESPGTCEQFTLLTANFSQNTEDLGPLHPANTIFSYRKS